MIYVEIMNALIYISFKIQSKDNVDCTGLNLPRNMFSVANDAALHAWTI